MNRKAPTSRGRFAPLLLACVLAVLPLKAAVAVQEGSLARSTLLANRQLAPALIEGIREARRSILCSYYLFKVGDSRENLPRRIAEELVRARRRGVDVTVILERQGSGKNDRLQDDNRATAALLSRGGVKVYFDPPGVTTHTKVTVIDDRYVYLGSHNLTEGALRYNNELSLFLESPDLAAELRSYLDRL